MSLLNKYTFVFIVFCTLAGAAHSQYLRPGEWRTYTAMTSVSDALVTPDSNILWATTQGGVYRVSLASAASGAVQGFRNTDGLSSNNCTAIARIPNGNIIVGDALGGLDIFSAKTGAVSIISDIALSTQYPNRRINRIVAHDSVLLIATGFGLSIYRLSDTAFDETVKQFGSHSQQDTVFDVVQSGDSIIVVLTNAIAIAPRSAPVLSAPFVWNIVTAPAGVTLRSVAAFGTNIIIGSEQGIFRYTGGTLVPISMPDSVSAIRFSATSDSLFLLDARGGRIVSTSDLQSFHYEQIQQASGQSSLTSLFVSSDHTRIVGFANGGLTIESPQTLIKGFAPDGPIDNNIVDLDFAQGIHTLFAAYGALGATAFEPVTEQWSHFSSNLGNFPNARFISITYDSLRQKLWLGSYGAALFRFDWPQVSNFVNFDSSKNIPESFSGGFTVVGRVSFDNSGNVLVPDWAGSGQGLVISKDGNTFTPMQLNPPGQSFHPYGTAVQDLDGNYYVATEFIDAPPPFGVSILFTDGSTESIIGSSGGQLASVSINALVVDQDNGIWCGTTSGVQVMSNSYNFLTGARQFSVRTLGFTNQQIVHSIVVDGIGNKWVGTEDGVFVFSPDGTDSLAHYTTANSPLIDNYVQAIAFDKSSGEAYFGTPSGISRFGSIFKQGAADYSKISIYPNPVIQSGDGNVTMTIQGLVQGSSLEVLTTAGKMVSRIDATNYGSTIQWNCRDDNNKLLPSGVYLIGAIAPNATSNGQAKFVLVRK